MIPPDHIRLERIAQFRIIADAVKRGAVIRFIIQDDLVELPAASTEALTHYVTCWIIITLQQSFGQEDLTRLARIQSLQDYPLKRILMEVILVGGNVCVSDQVTHDRLIIELFVSTRRVQTFKAAEAMGMNEGLDQLDGFNIFTCGNTTSIRDPVVKASLHAFFDNIHGERKHMPVACKLSCDDGESEALGDPGDLIAGSGVS